MAFEEKVINNPLTGVGEHGHIAIVRQTLAAGVEKTVRFNGLKATNKDNMLILWEGGTAPDATVTWASDGSSLALEDSTGGDFKAVVFGEFERI